MKIRESELLHSMIADVATDVVGVDVSNEGLSLLQKVNPQWKLILADACKFRPDFQFDLVIASELIEHLENPGEMLRCIASYSGENTELLITTPNAQSLKSALRAIVGKEECHRDHTLLFSTKTLTQLLARTGWSATKIKYYRVPAERLIMAIPSGLVHFMELFFSHRMRDGLTVLARLKSELPESTA